MSVGMDRILDNHTKVVEEGFVKTGGLKYRSYAVTTLRGGVGKSTLAFNLAYEISRQHSILISDLCAQRNLTENLMRGIEGTTTILDVLQPALLGAAFGKVPEDVSYRVSHYCDPFKGGQPAHFIPGSAELFAFPSALYQQLQIANAKQNESAIRNLLSILKDALSREAEETKSEITLLDTSPFYAGGTHLAWCASDAVIIPVRVDEHSIESLSLTLDLLSNPQKDFVLWNTRAGIKESPKVAAIVITMAGAKSQKKSTPDSASRMYIERALSIANQYKELFDYDDPADAFAITDDFMSTGRISGAKSTPIARLKVGSFHNVEGKRLQVNSSAERYKKEINYLVSIL